MSELNLDFVFDVFQFKACLLQAKPELGSLLLSENL